ncbi:aminotransferase class I/II-fold pyridoxal phosphate-dependent enzyme [Streptomyces caniscabiei]|uniref:aminotransferase class I/II-fold pyridoxal phosphate-dependent enzyme n=1 Tax=Streptomyces caniscabiei TaxID=2746961 RepID=UPI00076598ED|nr:aminotransferase class I/II-fold pyridoxal phosphate-dependent enzyme [Streptomyces caniscabiei]
MDDDTVRTEQRLDHSRTPVLEALERYRRGGRWAFSPPGHKGGPGVDARVALTLGPDVFASDVLALNGLDDRRMSGRVLERAEELMADAVDADRAYFSTCGSSLSVKASMLAVAGPHEKLLIARNAHKSVIAGVILAGIEPVWVRPRWDAEHRLSHPPGPEQVAEAFERAPDAKGMLLVTPTAYGTCADIAAIAEVCHARGRPLIVDEAWGAHLPFHEALPSWAMDAGADLCVTSVHKMGAGLEQGSVFHLRGDLVDPAVLRLRGDLLNTTSPSVLMWAALDGWRRQMAEHGHELLERALRLADRLRTEVAALPGLVPLADAELTGPGRAFAYDPLMVVIDVAGLGTSGYAAVEWLREHHGVDLGLGDHRRIVAQLTHADSEESRAALVDALTDLTERRASLPPRPDIRLPGPEELELESVMLPRDAFFGPVEQVPLEKAVGRVAAEPASPYPPGVPVICPGERIDRAVVEYLGSGVEHGMYVPDPSDPELRTLRVVAR